MGRRRGDQPTGDLHPATGRFTQPSGAKPLSYYSTDPQAAGRSPAELNGRGASNMIAYMKLLNAETAECLVGTHRYVRCEKDADGAKRLVRGEEGFVMLETDTFIRLAPVRVAKASAS
jgi:hypothetical protein